MKSSLSVFAAGVVLALALAARANAAGTDYSDLWWNPDESGWGVGLQRQGDVIFMTLFVYGNDGSSTWFVAPDVRPLPAASSTWGGALYRAAGPGFASQYDASVQATEAGSATLEFQGANAGILRYTVDGAPVEKAITRMTWREPSAAGRYHGGFSSFVAQCADVTRVGAYDFLGELNVTQSGRQVVATVTSAVVGLPSTCTFAAASSQSGRLAAWSGTFNCNVVIGLDERGENVARVLRSGTFAIERIAITSSGFRGALVAADQDCAFTGHFGGTRLP